MRLADAVKQQHECPPAEHHHGDGKARHAHGVAERLIGNDLELVRRIYVR